MWGFKVASCFSTMSLSCPAQTNAAAKPNIFSPSLLDWLTNASSAPTADQDPSSHKTLSTAAGATSRLAIFRCFCQNDFNESPSFFIVARQKTMHSSKWPVMWFSSFLKVSFSLSLVMQVMKSTMSAQAAGDVEGLILRKCLIKPIMDLWLMELTLSRKATRGALLLGS